MSEFMNSDTIFRNFETKNLCKVLKYGTFVWKQIFTNMKRYFSCFFFFSLFAISFLSAQVNEKDLKKMSYDELKVFFFNERTSVFEQKKIAGEFVKKAKKENDESKLARGYYFYSLAENEMNVSIKYLDSITQMMKPNSEDLSFPILAYYQKGVLYGKMFNYELAIKNFLIVEEISHEFNNLEYYYDSKYAIGKLKSENLGEVRDGLSLFKECLNYYKKQDFSKGYFADAYQRTIFALADSYKSLNELDSASYYNNLGYKESKKIKNNRLHFLFILNEGANQVLKKNYYAAIDSINIALPKLKEISNVGNNILASYYYYGKAYEGLMKYEKAIVYFNKVDSIYQKSGIITPEFTDGYRFLLNYYKKKGNKEKQLYYINTLMAIDSSFQNNYRILTRKIQKDYDIPHLMQEKETIIKGLHQDKKANYWIIGILGFAVVLSLVVMQHLTKQKKQYKQRFEALMQQNKTESLTTEVEEQQEKSADLGIPEDVVVAILKQLAVFENKKQYLKPNITLGDLATAFETNSKYVSIVINAKKQKSFSNYINDLRIDHAVEGLKNNKEMRKYTIKAIAEEVGFNNAEAFSNAFFRRTGIKPSYFVKKIQEG